MNILFVCSGNTCRSPMAEGYLKSLNLPGVFVKSAGVAVSSFSGVNPNSVAVMDEIGINILGHYPTQITKTAIDWADEIICMNSSHKNAILSVESGKNISVLGGGIFDPYGSGVSVYRECLDQIINEINLKFLNIGVVRAQKSHIADIAELEKICFSEPWSENAISEAINNGTEIFVAIKNNTFAGYAGINCVLDEGYITNIAVTPEFRKQGVAQKLLDKLDFLAKQNPLKFITLEVRRSNAGAIQLYTKNGYSPEGERKGFYNNPKEDAVIMTKRFL